MMLYVPDAFFKFVLSFCLVAYGSCFSEYLFMLHLENRDRVQCQNVIDLVAFNDVSAVSIGISVFSWCLSRG